MTALPQYELLEAEGRHIAADGSGPHDVIVKFGDASLIILDHDDLPITHWPLATLRRVGAANRGDGAALTVTPDPTGAERLTLADATMVEAIRAVCPDLEPHRPAPQRRWRRMLMWAVGALGAAYLIAFHLVPSLSDQLAELIPPDAEIAMGETMTAHIAELITGFETPHFCTEPEGADALAKLTARLEQAAGAHVPLSVLALDHHSVNAVALPGGRIIITGGFLSAADTPEEVAAVLAHEIGHVVHRDPTRLTLRAAGVSGLIRVLLGDFAGDDPTFALSQALLNADYGREVEDRADGFATDLLARQGLPTTPFAAFLRKLAEADPQEEQVASHLGRGPDGRARAARALAADTIGDQPFRPALSDQKWIALRGVCR